MLRTSDFEPSVLSVLNHVLNGQWTAIAGEDQMHVHVAYPLAMRTTGLGRIEGGELVLVPPSRSVDILPSVPGLCETGISGIVLFGLEPRAAPMGVGPCKAPVIAIQEPLDLQLIRERIDRYIVRRRRELFALEQRLHRRFVDAAIAGATAQELLQWAADETGAELILDRGGDVIGAPGLRSYPNAHHLIAARIALRREAGGRASSAEPPRMLSLEVVGGGERKGIVAAFGLREERQDEDEAVMMALASAMSIVLARAPAVRAPTLSEIVSRRTAPAEAENQWSTLAVSTDEFSIEAVQRVLGNGGAVRGSDITLAVHDGALIVLAREPTAVSWDVFLSQLRLRARSETISAGIGRPYRGSEGLMRSAREAVLALGRANGEVLHYATIELTVLLESLADGTSFAQTTLAPLLDGVAAHRELLDTMRVYLATGRNAKEAARRLAVHRNTLLYRLRRAEELLAIRWDDADSVFAMDMALRLLALSEVAPAQGDDNN